ncbi:GNAT family N-acetyltransferase [Tundrisphaera lichenicola]|uniref:GNAT family N-acetyltransferase n=1 Tax=Tundrisphaera lichenicola TaxID=2029860 RepID=UPI003EB9F56C
MSSLHATRTGLQGQSLDHEGMLTPARSIKGLTGLVNRSTRGESLEKGRDRETGGILKTMDELDLDLGFCRIRPLKFADAASIAREANDFEIWINLRDRFPHPYRLEDALAWLGLVVGCSPATDFAIEVEAQAIGVVGITPGVDVFRRSAEIGYWLGRGFRGRGITTAAVREVTRYAFDRFDLIRLQAGVFAWNPASARVLEKCGYALEGRLRSSVIKNGRITDQLLYASIRD